MTTSASNGFKERARAYSLKSLMSQRAQKEERDKTDQVFVRDADREQRDPRGNSISGTSCER